MVFYDLAYCEGLTVLFWEKKLFDCSGVININQSKVLIRSVLFQFLETNLKVRKTLCRITFNTNGKRMYKNM